MKVQVKKVSAKQLILRMREKFVARLMKMTNAQFIDVMERIGM